MFIHHYVHIKHTVFIHLLTQVHIVLVQVFLTVGVTVDPCGTPLYRVLALIAGQFEVTLDCHILTPWTTLYAVTFFGMQGVFMIPLNDVIVKFKRTICFLLQEQLFHSGGEKHLFGLVANIISQHFKYLISSVNLSDSLVRM